MSFWRKEVIDFALDFETRREIADQREWIAREPANPQPYYNLAQLYRMCSKAEEALGLLLHAVALDPFHAAAHVSLAEIYAVRGDYRSARGHALAARDGGDARAAQLLERYGALE